VSGTGPATLPPDFLAGKARRVRAERAASAPRGEALEAMRVRAAAASRPPALGAALRAGEHVAVIAEFKRRSPSGGSLAERADPRAVARGYAAAGARGVSVLTDTDDFGGRLADLAAVTQQVALPSLCKDFVVDEARLCEARLAGAAAALLIVRMLNAAELERLLAAATALGLECLVEVHDEAELDRALAVGAALIGINNRDLATLRTDLAVTERLARLVPAGATIVSESGIRTPDDIRRLAAAGAHAVLVGAALLCTAEQERDRLLRTLTQVPR
jgi:indole-3-glycerol phosphate synthase